MKITSINDLNDAENKLAQAREAVEYYEKAIEDYKQYTPEFEVNKFYRWNFPKWRNGSNPPGQGGRLQCVYVTKEQVVLRNQHGLHIVATRHLKNCDIVLTA